LADAHGRGKVIDCGNTFERFADHGGVPQVAADEFDFRMEI
jgi:hypothetical protein